VLVAELTGTFVQLDPILRPARDVATPPKVVPEIDSRKLVVASLKFNSSDGFARYSWLAKFCCGFGFCATMRTEEKHSTIELMMDFRITGSFL
jgi:hypothetical protein